MSLSTEISLLGILLVSLMGSTHCAGMCGGFVMLYSGEKAPVSFFVHALYHLGRLTTYLTLGILAGIIGRSFDNAAALAGVQQASLLITGVLLLLWGTKLVFYPTASSLSLTDSIFGRIYKSSLGTVMSNTETSQHRRAFFLGLLTTLLPCGWLWVYVLFASGTGDPLKASMIMFFFWMGTVPILTGLGVFNRVISSRLRNFAPRANGMIMILAGTLSLLMHAGYSFGIHDHHAHTQMNMNQSEHGTTKDTPKHEHSQHHHMH